jgi:hypothetical protein
MQVYNQDQSVVGSIVFGISFFILTVHSAYTMMYMAKNLERRNDVISLDILGLRGDHSHPNTRKDNVHCGEACYFTN